AHDGQLLARSVPEDESLPGWIRQDLTGDGLSAERLRALRHDRQCLGMDQRRVPRAWRYEALLHARSAGGQRGAGPGRRVSLHGDQGRVAPLRGELLQALPAGGPLSADDRHVDFAHGVSLCARLSRLSGDLRMAVDPTSSRPSLATRLACRTACGDPATIDAHAVAGAVPVMS